MLEGGVGNFQKMYNPCLGPLKGYGGELSTTGTNTTIATAIWWSLHRYHSTPLTKTQPLHHDSYHPPPWVPRSHTHGFGGPTSGRRCSLQAIPAASIRHRRSQVRTCTFINVLNSPQPSHLPPNPLIIPPVSMKCQSTTDRRMRPTSSLRRSPLSAPTTL